MKIEFYANDYMDIYVRIPNNTTIVEFGRIFKQNNGEEWKSSDIPGFLEDVDFVDLFHLLGFNLENVKSEIGNYLWEKDAFIRIKKFHDTDVIYSILENVTEEVIASSTDFMRLIEQEVFNKENNASL